LYSVPLSAPLRILIADDHEVVRRGLKGLLESHAEWQIAGEAGNGLEVVQKATELKPDVVVLDITMPELNGLEAARRIHKVLPQIEVLFLTVHDSEQMVREALDAGGRGYLLKSDAGRDLLAAVESVRQHKFFLSPRITQMLGSGSMASALSKQEASASGLTPREREVLKLLSEGKSTKEAAVVLEIAVKTAETHRTNIMRKLGLHSISDLVRYAIRNKVVEP
jgi:DNA-binding NarL/FixJ family response regulator